MCITALVLIFFVYNVNKNQNTETKSLKWTLVHFQITAHSSQTFGYGMNSDFLPFFLTIIFIKFIFWISFQILFCEVLKSNSSTSVISSQINFPQLNKFLFAYELIFFFDFPQGFKQSHKFFWPHNNSS